MCAGLDLLHERATESELRNGAASPSVVSNRVISGAKREGAKAGRATTAEGGGGDRDGFGVA